MTKHAIAQLRDDSKPLISIGPGQDVDKWKEWNSWTTEQMAKNDLEPVEFDLESVKPRTRPAMLKYVRAKMGLAPRTKKRTESGQDLMFVLNDLKQQVSKKIFCLLYTSPSPQD